jgi:hypothetical protein
MDPFENPFRPGAGRRNLNLHNLLKLATGLGVDPAELVQGLQPPEE